MFKNPEKTKFKNGSGQFLLKALFYEENEIENKDYILYTLKDDDYEVRGKLLPSLAKLYLEMEDITEYEFAKKYLYSWEHWKLLSNSTFFKPYIQRWREELKLKLLYRALNKITQIAESDSKESFLALKYLVAESWKDKPRVLPKRGRPEKEPEAVDYKNLNKVIEEDFSRIFGTDNKEILN